MVRVITFLIKGISMWSLKQAVSIVRYGTLPALRMILWTLGATLWVIAMSAVSLHKGVPNAARTIAKDWKGRAIEAGFPYAWEDYLDTPFYVLATATIYTTWLLSIFILAFIADLTYHWMF